MFTPSSPLFPRALRDAQGNHARLESHEPNRTTTTPPFRRTQVVQPASAPDAVSPSFAAMLPALRAQGLPVAAGAVVGLEALKPQQRSAARKAAEAALMQHLGVTEAKVMAAESAAEAGEFLRQLTVRGRRVVLWGASAIYRAVFAAFLARALWICSW